MYLLTELVRLLEQRGHIFPADPDFVTETLRQTDGSPAEKLMRRADMIDRDRTLADRLHSHSHRAKLVFQAACILWLALGFAATYGLMRQSSLNFFLILAGVLWLNSIMLLFWLFLLLRRRSKNSMFDIERWWRGKDPVGQALAALYAESAAQPARFWQISQTGHALALSTLLGMSAAALLLLTVRQYSFNWESTLLGGDTFVSAVSVLSWLPRQLGFPVPDAAAVLANRNQADTAHAALWGSLLLGSIFCYGILPRLLAWLICRIQAARRPMRLDLSLPYYQNILQKWQRRIIDSADDYRPDTPAPTPPQITLQAHSRHWAVQLDAPHHQTDWFYRILGQDWINKGLADSRSSIGALADELATSPEPVQLLVGVRAHHAPDRGIVRQLAKLAEHAAAGIVVQLWTAPRHTAPDELLTQWRTVLQQNGWAWIDPPEVSQTKRQQTPPNGQTA